MGAAKAGRVVVVGAGILGALHALFALERGLEVVHLEKDPRPQGASVRNFGLVWVGGRAGGAELELALRARALWEEVAERVEGLGWRAAGSLTVATEEAELSLMKQACERADAALRKWQLLDGPAAHEANPEISPETAGALHCGADALVEPRLAVHALRKRLEGFEGYNWFPGREVMQVAPRKVRDDRGEWYGGDRVFVCPGATTTAVVRGFAGLARTRRVRLQMLETAPYQGRLTTSLADADSMRYYPAFDLPGRASLPPQPEVAARWHAQLLLVQRLDGSLTIGDTHEYDEPFAFDLDDEIYRHLLARATSLLRRPLPPVRRRWAGVYSEVRDASRDLYWREEIDDGVEVVSGVGGRGMTCSPAIAEQSIAHLAG